AADSVPCRMHGSHGPGASLPHVPSRWALRLLAAASALHLRQYPALLLVRRLCPVMPHACPRGHSFPRWCLAGSKARLSVGPGVCSVSDTCISVTSPFPVTVIWV